MKATILALAVLLLAGAFFIGDVAAGLSADAARSAPTRTAGH